MTIETVFDGVRYTLSNENLQEGDKVFPIAEGRITKSNVFIFHNLNYEKSGFPDDPHIIEALNYSKYKPYEINTNQGYGPREKYFKIIKKERRVEIQNLSSFFRTYKWETYE